MQSKSISITILDYSIDFGPVSIYNYIDFERLGDGMADSMLIIKRRGDDGYKVISVRIKEDTLEALDKLAAETNYSRNELINLLLRHGVEHVEIE